MKVVILAHTAMSASEQAVCTILHTLFAFLG